ncbi:hypothetical protein KP509_35G017700 [Ceratopteris richardii]|uniref:Uncharacterized protein n=1 Tax=Ceratopteris richardii TaxID=49495 RepID=A0A8T2QDI8_CERRI|nr:hypothetical protein KP509_35G017700 [Ceratopteris richardii]
MIVNKLEDRNYEEHDPRTTGQKSNSGVLPWFSENRMKKVIEGRDQPLRPLYPSSFRLFESLKVLAIALFIMHGTDQGAGFQRFKDRNLRLT